MYTLNIKILCYYNIIILLFYLLSFINFIQYLFLLILYLHIYDINNLLFITQLSNINKIKYLLQIRIYPNQQCITNFTYNIYTIQTNRNIRIYINNWILNINGEDQELKKNVLMRKEIVL